MTRPIGLTLVAVTIICGGIAIAVASSDLASATMTVGNERIAFRIYERNGFLFAGAEELRAGSNGRGTISRIGEADVIGRESPAIIDESAKGRVLLRVGKTTVVYDASTKSLGVPEIAK